MFTCQIKNENKPKFSRAVLQSETERSECFRWYSKRI